MYVIVNDIAVEVSERFLVAIALPAGSPAVLDSSVVPQTTSVVTITDNDTGADVKLFLPVTLR